MTFTISSITRCTGGSHIRMTGTINGQPATVDFAADELLSEPSEMREAAIMRMRSAVKEASATTPNQIRNALEGKTFKV